MANFILSVHEDHSRKVIPISANRDESEHRKVRIAEWPDPAAAVPKAEDLEEEDLEEEDLTEEDLEEEDLEEEDLEEEDLTEAS